MPNLLRRILGGALLSVISCSSDTNSGAHTNSGPHASCTSNGSCPNRAPPTQSEITQCQARVGDAKCGAAFQTYFDCAARVEVCTDAGVTDDAATKSAIAANCGFEAAAYRSCAGNSSPQPTCGYSGADCCTDGSAPCISTACCDPATHKCRGPGDSCTADHTVCVANQCVACGAPGNPCCQIFGTTQTNACPFGGCCYYGQGQAAGACLAEGAQCRAATAMSGETVCHAGTCTACGTTLDPCCAGSQCTSPNSVCSTTDATCVPCGGTNEPCCGNQCFTNTQCTAGMCP